ncbi:MAG: tripartite tricarboxylate transporter substrate binding protein BugD [Alphaproteobacteria bacterium]|nr:tripartite tricarboxylate transporter substrate binding protein BugD [Alphaproteobacteria bacterium]
MALFFATGRALAPLVAMVCFVGLASAQAYPERIITMIVPFAAGGATDVTGRIMGDAMSKRLGQTIVVENVAGAGGATGSLRGKNSKPDGYTIGVGHMGTHAAAVSTNPKLPYDPRTDFDYLGIVNVTPNLLIVRKDFPADTLQAFTAYAKANGKGLKMAHNGLGSLSHLTCVLYFQLIEVDPTYVVYRGFGQTINDILSGAVDGTCDLVASVTGHVKGGSVKAFGVADEARSPVLPDVPTATEGGLPAFKVESWLGLYAPKATPAPILARLRQAVAESLADADVQKRFFDLGGSVPKPHQAGGDKMLEIIKADVVRWAEVVKKAGGIEATN